MATKSRPRPGDEIKPDIKPGFAKSDGSHDEGAISPGEQAKFDQIEKGEQDRDRIARDEKNASTTDGHGSSLNGKEKRLSEKPDDTVGKGFTKRETKNRVSTKKKIFVGGGLVGLISGGMLLSSIITGPFQVLTFANTLKTAHFGVNNSVSESRLGNFYRYLRYPNSPEQRRLSLLGRKYSNHIEAKFKESGIELNWENGRLASATIEPTEAYKLRNAGFGENMKITDGGKYKWEIDPAGTKAKVARGKLKDLRSGVKAIDDKIGYIASRTLKTKADLKFFDPSTRRIVQNVKTTLKEKFNDYKAKKAKLKSPAETEGVKVTGKEPDADPNKAPPTEEVDIAGTKAATRLKVEAAKAAKGIAIIGLACAVYQITDNVSSIKKANVILPMMRYGMRVLSVAGQIRAGDVDADNLGFFIQDLYDESADPNARSWSQAASIQANMGLPVTGAALPNSMHPTKSGGFIIQAFDSIPGVVGNSFDSVCGALSSTAGKYLSYALDTYLGIGRIAQTLVTKLFADRYMDDLINLLAGDELDIANLAGAVNGSAADYGVFLAAQESRIDAGGRKLSAQESAEIRTFALEEQRAEIAKTSVFERYFNPNNINSLLAKTAFASSSAFRVGNIGSSIGNSVGRLSTVFSSIFNFGLVNKTYAISNNYDYGMPTYGFSLAELNDERYDNPLENQDIIYDQLKDKDIQEKINKCFGVRVEDDMSISPIPDATRAINADRDTSGCDNTDETWTRIRFYIQDESVATAAACLGNIAGYCSRYGY